MITDINVVEEWNREGTCWDSIITWKYNGKPNKVVCNTTSYKCKQIMFKLIDAQCTTNKEIQTKIVYRKR